MAVLVLVLYIQVKIMSIYSFILIFPDQTIMAQSGNGAASESDVTSLGTGQGLNFDDDTLKGKNSDNVNIISTEGGFSTFYLDLAFPRICGRVYHLWQNEWLFWY